MLVSWCEVRRIREGCRNATDRQILCEGRAGFPSNQSKNIDEISDYQSVLSKKSFDDGKIFE